MKWIDLSLHSPQENLAMDEALLEMADTGLTGPIIRYWEPDRYFVVLGYSNSTRTEVNMTACKSDQVPVHRRISGGGTVLQGPGMLNYTLILPIGSPVGENERIPKTIREINTFVMDRQKKTIEKLIDQPVSVQGHTDLTIGNLKFSGNAQRRFKNTALFHGAFLLSADLKKMEKYLPFPSLQPQYREDRSHQQFLTNLALPSSRVKAALGETWQVSEELNNPPLERTNELVLEKYGTDAWRERFS